MPKFVAKSVLGGLTLIGLSVAFASGTAVAVTTDDVKWINQCVKDNSDQDAKRLVVLRYCTCMNNKMSDDETLSISEWEQPILRSRRHVRQRRAGNSPSGASRLRPT